MTNYNKGPKTGHWVKNEEYNGWETVLKDCYCSVCCKKALLKRSYSMDGESITFCLSKYCPNCGVKMESEVKG